MLTVSNLRLDENWGVNYQPRVARVCGEGDAMETC